MYLGLNAEILTRGQILTITDRAIVNSYHYHYGQLIMLVFVYY